MNDLVDLNFGGPAPPQRTAASLDPWSPVGGAGGGVLQQSTLPDPWGGIGAVGVPPSRASPLAFPAPSPPAPANDPWGPAEPAQTPAQDPWGAPARPGVSPNPGKDKRGSVVGHFAALCPAVDPFSPADPLDPLAGLGGLQSTNGNGHGVFGGSPVGGAASPPRPANPWDLSGLDPVGGAQLLGAAPLQVGGTDESPGERLCLDCFDNGFYLIFFCLFVYLQETGAKPKTSTVESLLGEHSALVNLDSLVGSRPQQAGPGTAAKNPFADQPNPFQAAAAPKPTINQLRTGAPVSWRAVQSRVVTVCCRWPGSRAGPGRTSNKETTLTSTLSFR